MLRRLRLEEFVIIDEVEISFDDGLNVVTGETGTGKSIICDAIGFVGGGRGDAGWVRAGASRMMVEALFDVDSLPAAAALATEYGCPPDSGEIRIRREMVRGGRGKAWIQDRSVRLSQLRELGTLLLAIHGQGEHRRLLDPAAQLELVDRFANASPLRESYVVARARWREEQTRFTKATQRLAELKEKEEWLRLQLEEIDAAKISPGEEESLRRQKDSGKRQAQGIEARDAAEMLLFEEEGCAADRMETLLHKTERLDKDWDDFRSEVTGARDALRRAKDAMPRTEDADLDDPAAVEERLIQLGRLKKKYGGSEEAILERRESLAGELDEAESLGLRIDRMKSDLDEARDAAATAAKRLRKKRSQVSKPLARSIISELRELGMPGADLEFVLDEEADESEESLVIDGVSLRSFTDGVDQGWFKLRPNPGEGAGPLATVASGGELSRTLLALLTVLGSREEPRTAIFDEVDAGVGGATARAVAHRLVRLAEERQVLLVTHLPLIACKAGNHVRVEKLEKKGRTYARIATLDHEGRIGELARMLAGEVDSSIARKHAEELLNGAAVTEA